MFTAVFMTRVSVFLSMLLSQSVFAEQDPKLFESVQKATKIVVADTNDERYKYWERVNSVNMKLVKIHVKASK